MGGSASALASNLSGKIINTDQLDPALLSILGPNISHELTVEQIMEMCKKKTDVFLTHNWGVNQDNHKRVAEVNRKLKERGFITWFDEEKMEGNVKKKMTEGIDNASCVFVTQVYIDKVDGPNGEDNCQLEFGYAARKKTNKKMVSVVMEPSVRNTNIWNGEVGMVMGGLLYVDMCDTVSNAKICELESKILSCVGSKLDDLFQNVSKVWPQLARK